MPAHLRLGLHDLRSPGDVGLQELETFDPAGCEFYGFLKKAAKPMVARSERTELAEALLRSARLSRDDGSVRGKRGLTTKTGGDQYGGYQPPRTARSIRAFAACQSALPTPPKTISSMRP